MSKLPKVKIKTIPGHPEGEVRDFEQARNLFPSGGFVFVEGYRVSSYEELAQLAAKNSYKDREFLEVVILSAGLVDGG